MERMKSYITEWKYYNHALIPANAPHEETDESFLEHTHFWKEFREALFVVWTASFDCYQETDWWYVIKDSVFDISKLKAKRRYEIKKGIKNFSVKRIDPGSYKEELFKVQVAAFSAYSEKYRPVVEHDSFCNAIDKWNVFTVYGAFSNEDFQLSGYVFIAGLRRLYRFLCVKNNS